MMQKVLFCGLGSMGMRHLRNLAKLFRQAGESYEIHAMRSSRRALPDGVKDLVEKEFHSWDSVEYSYDMAFITNPTSEHYHALGQVVCRTKRIFIEKPVFQCANTDVGGLGLTDSHICYVAAPLRYTRAIRYIKEFLAGRKVLSVRSICSSYLPEWRPGTNWKECYSANVAMGGGVDLDLIHEWDYLVYLFGFPTEVHAIHGRYSDITVDSCDNAVYIASYPRMSVSLHLDYFGRVPCRRMELFLEDDVVEVDFIQGRILFRKLGKCMDVSEERDDMQMEELRYFLHLRNNRENENRIGHAIRVLELAKGEGK